MSDIRTLNTWRSPFILIIVIFHTYTRFQNPFYHCFDVMAEWGGGLELLYIYYFIILFMLVLVIDKEKNY